MMIHAPAARLTKFLFRAGWLLGLLLLGRLGAAPQYADENALIDRVVELVERRLALMPEVAAVKFRQQQAIADPARERVVLDQSVAEAQALQVEPEAARAFFAVQIRLARAVQEHWFERWRTRGETPPPARDLVTVLRPELDGIGRELLPAVYRASPALVALPAAMLRERVARLGRQPGASEDLIGELAQALGALRLTAAPTWATVQKVGVLRVGTTGDYAPFSDDHGGELRGFDIELAQDLAKAWGVRVMFVRTSWPTLMDDLAKRRFELAASGISVTPERQRVAEFSAAYHYDGKTPIARRADAARFSSLEQIDQPGVRVVVNPGGTNERFAREHIRRATIVSYPDNRSIFEEIVAGRADVMMTDGIEVKLQERRQPTLSATRAEPFTRTGKAVLLASGSELTARVDMWLVPQIKEGQISARLERALDEAK
jgi:cyclohexadienyl dehydratase